MSVFNFMESFFFISLGVTFILILLLVYHFKQRLSMVENKADTMVDIMNNMVKEMGIIKNLATSQIPRNFQQQQQQPPFQNIQVPITYLDVVQDSNRIVVSENDTESEDESDEDNDEDDSDDEDDSEDEDDSDDEDDEDDDKENEEDEKENEEEETPIDNFEVEVILSDIISDIDIDNSIKIETVPVPEIETVQETETLQETETEDYTKMSIIQLKSLVVAKGLVADASKMKKKHILDLLSTSK